MMVVHPLDRKYHRQCSSRFGSKQSLLRYAHVRTFKWLIAFFQVIFYLEDCTTLLIWYITGTYKTTDEEGDEGQRNVTSSPSLEMHHLMHGTPEYMHP